MVNNPKLDDPREYQQTIQRVLCVRAILTISVPIYREYI